MEHASYLDQIGQAKEIEGIVSVIRTDGRLQQLHSGDLLYLNDTLVTGADGLIAMSFLDSSEFSLGQNGTMTFDELAFYT